MKWVIRLCLIMLVLKLLESYRDFQHFQALYQADRKRLVQPRRYTIAEIETMNWSSSP